VSDGLAGDDTDAMAFLAEPDGEDVCRHQLRIQPLRSAPRCAASGAATGEDHVVGHQRQARFLGHVSRALTYLKQDLIEYQVRLLGLEDEWAPRAVARSALRHACAQAITASKRGRVYVPAPGARPAATEFTHRPGLVADGMGARIGVAADRSA